MAISKFSFRPESLHVKYILAFIAGIIVGFKALPVPVVAVFYLIIIAACFIRCLKGNITGFFSLIPYVVYTEVFVRAFARWVPYLTIQYFYIIGFAILFFTVKRQKIPHSNAWFFLVLYTFLDVVDNIYPDKAIIGRAIQTNSFALLVPVVWSSYNIIKPVLINKLLNNIKIAAVYLAGIVFVAHLTGTITYGLSSNSDSSNGLAPVQLSGYLGFGCILFFLSIMNPEEIKNRLTNMIVLALVATIMVLTFSRGGLYFLGAITALFLFYNRAQLANYARLLIFIPVGFIIYLYVVSQTGGKIVERYELKGTSSRDVLVDIGFIIFSEHVVFGVGTGNFNTTIVREKLYPEESGAHNEYVRAAAEHGIIGILFYWGFYLFLFFEILRRNKIQKQYAMYFFVLFCLIIVHNGLKIAIQPLLIMLVIATPSFIYKSQKNVYDKEFAAARVA